MDGKWSASAYLGGTDSTNAGLTFVLYTALVDQGGSGKAAIQTYLASAPNCKPIDPLPPGIQLISQIQVVRQ